MNVIADADEAVRIIQNALPENAKEGIDNKHGQNQKADDHQCENKGFTGQTLEFIKLFFEDQLHVFFRKETRGKGLNSPHPVIGGFSTYLFKSHHICEGFIYKIFSPQSHQDTDKE